jgi:hypothetical protein
LKFTESAVDFFYAAKIIDAKKDLKTTPLALNKECFFLRLFTLIASLFLA